MKRRKISVIIPRYNESLKLIKKTIERVKTYLTSKRLSFEIIISQNGKNKKLHQFDKKIILLFDKKKGLGLAIKNAIRKARGEYFYFLPSDIPFNFTDLERMLELSASYDFIAGSKLHPQSIYEINFLRKFLSLFQQKIAAFFLPKLLIKDVNGSYFGNIKKIKRFILETKSDDFFFGTELICKLNVNKFKVTEVPVMYKKLDAKSSVNILKDGLSYLRQLLQLSMKLHHTLRMRKSSNTHPEGNL